MSGEGDTVNKTQKNGNKKLLVLLAFLCVIICGLVVGIIIVVVNNNNESSGDNDLVLNSCEDVQGYLADYQDIDNLESFIIATDKALAVSTNDEVKFCVYSSRFGMLYNYSVTNGDDYITQVVDDAYAMESISPTAKTAYNIYISEKMADNVDKAEEWLKVAEERGITNNQGRG